MRLDVGAALGRGRARAAAAAAEEPAEEVGEVEVGELRAGAATAKPAPPMPAVRRAEGVVGLPLLGVGQHVVGALDLLEARLVAASPWFASGWCSRASLRYAFLISSAEAFFGDAERLVQVRHFTPPRSLGHDHAGRPEHPVAEPVALLQDLQHRALLGAVGGLGQQRLVDVRVEGAVGLDLGEPVPREEAEQRAVDELDALLELRLLVLRGRLERPLEVVEHRQQLVQEPLVRAAGPARPGRARRACGSCRSRPRGGGRSRRGAGRRSSSAGESSSAGSSSTTSSSPDLLVLEPRLERLVGHEVFASSSSSITS